MSAFVNRTLLNDCNRAEVNCLSSLLLLGKCTDCPSSEECQTSVAEVPEGASECSSNATNYDPRSVAAEVGGGGVRDDDGSRTNNWFALLLFLIVAVAIAGNILVCLAVYCKRKLQNMFNYFLVSLAMSDMLSAILVMPLSIMRAAIGELTLLNVRP